MNVCMSECMGTVQSTSAVIDLINRHCYGHLPVLVSIEKCILCTH